MFECSNIKKIEKEKTMDEIIALDKELLLALNGSHSLFIDGLAQVLTKAATWILLYAALIYLVIKNSENIRQIFTIIGCAVMCAILAGTIDDTFVKPLVARLRPTHDTEIGILVDVVDEYRGGSYGFFSAHAANTFSLAIFFCWLVRNRVLSIMLVVWSLANCWTRLYLGVHYPLDILVGLTWGAVVGSLMYLVYTKINITSYKDKNFISTQYTSTGFTREDCLVPINVLALTFIYVIVRAVI